jgi:U3 small nucleolar RNA-associated protein 10
MRSEEAAVRLAAVEALTALYAKLGEEWLPLLPESVPVIAELMEDDEEEVERAVQRLVVKVEEFLGHGELEAMLQ